MIVDSMGKAIVPARAAGGPRQAVSRIQWCAAKGNLIKELGEHKNQGWSNPNQDTVIVPTSIHVAYVWGQAGWASS